MKGKLVLALMALTSCQPSHEAAPDVSPLSEREREEISRDAALGSIEAIRKLSFDAMVRDEVEESIAWNRRGVALGDCNSLESLIELKFTGSTEISFSELYVHEARMKCEYASQYIIEEDGIFLK